MAERLTERLARLERERQDADRLYNDALTAFDRVLQSRPALADPPAPYDATKLPEINRSWDILPDGPPTFDRSLKGRLRGFVWRLVGPALDTQRQLNAALVDHLNRNVAAHQQAQEATARLIAALDEHLNGQVAFQAHLIRLLQTVTLYVDSKDRAVAGGQEVLNAGIAAITDAWLKRWESLDVRIAHRLASVDDLRATATLAQQTALSLKREVERLLVGPTGATGSRNELTLANSSFDLEKERTSGSSHLEPAARVAPVVPDLNAFKYLGFEDQFRGSQEDISRRLAEYVPLFDGLSDVLDVGCGRGEFLDLLKARGTPARGLDLNHAMVEASRQRGLDVAEGDALAYLSSLPDESIGGLFAAQVIEHLAPEYLENLLETAAHKLRPGGLVVLETINPACWLAFFESYIRDLTHVRPIHPETIQYLMRVSGFHDVSIAFKSPVAESTRLQTLPQPTADTSPDLADVVKTFNENVTKLNTRMFTYQDYAAIGRK